MRSLSLFLLALVPLATALPGVAGSAKTPVTCAGAIQHPVEARVVALDPIRRGAVVRFEVTSRANAEFRSPRARVLEGRGVQVVGPARAALVARPGNRDEQTATFRVVVPPSGHRALVQFLVEGEGPAGTLTRGAVYNLLPDGPAETLRIATSGSGDALLETPARRIDR